MTDETELLTNPYAVTRSPDAAAPQLVPNARGEVEFEYELEEEDLAPDPRPVAASEDWFVFGVLRSVIFVGIVGLILSVTAGFSGFSGAVGLCVAIGLDQVRNTFPRLLKSRFARAWLLIGLGLLSICLMLIFPLDLQIPVGIWIGIFVDWTLLISHKDYRPEPVGLEKAAMLGPRWATIGPSGLTIISEFEKTEWSWIGFEGLEFIGERIYLLRSPRRAVVVPLRTFSTADQAMVVALVKKYHIEATQAGVQPMPEMDVPAAMNDDKSSRPAMVSKD